VDNLLDSLRSFPFELSDLAARLGSLLYPGVVRAAIVASGLPNSQPIADP